MLMSLSNCSRLYVYNIFIMTLIFDVTTESSNSFTPITCYDCQTSSSSGSDGSPSGSSNSYSANDDDPSSSQGQYVGSVIAAPLDEHVSLTDNSKYSTPYNPSDSFLRVSSSYSTSAKSNQPKSKYSSLSSPYSTDEYQKKPTVKDRFHPTTYQGPQNSIFRAPGLAGALGNLASALRGATFRDPGGGLTGGSQFLSPGDLPGNSGFSSPVGSAPGGFPFGSQTSGVNTPGNSQFGSPEGLPFGGPEVGLRGNTPGSSPFGFPGGGFPFGPLGGGTPSNSPFGSLGGGTPSNSPFGSLGGGNPANSHFGSLGDASGGLSFGPQGSGLGGSSFGNSPFGTPGGNLPAGPFGSPGIGGLPGNNIFNAFGSGLGNGIPGTSPFGSVVGGLKGALPDSTQPGSPSGSAGNSANNLLGNGLFGSSVAGFPAAAGFGNAGGSATSTGGDGGTGGLSSQQVIGDLEMESGVGEVVQPAQTELKPEVAQISNSNSAVYKPSQSAADYGYGYSASLYQQPLPDITEAPTPSTNIINESPPPVPVDKPTTAIQGGGVPPIGAPPPPPPPPPVPVGVSPPIYGYYYIGRKAWYVPLYFCVYFIVYVGCLIIKGTLKHKAHYPGHLHDAVVEGDARKNSDPLDSLTETVLSAIDKLSYKFSKIKLY